MAELTMPKMGDSMEEGTISQWLKKEGDRVEEQEPIAEIETEKASIEIPAYEAGVLAKILIPVGQTVPVGTPIALIQREGEAEAPQRAEAPQAEAGTVEARPDDREQQPGPATSAPARGERASAGAGEPSRQQAPGGGATRASRRPGPRAEPAASPHGDDARVKASPLARKIAAERGIDLREVRGTGPGGRIVEADLEELLTTRPERPAAPGAGRAEPARPEPAPRAAAEPAAAPLAAEERELSPMRRTIARRLVESKQTIPHFYVTSEIDMEAAMAFREQLNAADPERQKVPPDALVVRACALALRKYRAVNSQLVENRLRTPQEINVGVAVALEDGLIVPVVRHADQKSVTQISGEIRALAERARAGQLKPAEFSGGTFTISNLGMFDVESFSAIINPPEAAILAVGTIAQVPVVKQGELAVGTRMKVTISADHRIVDGAVAAQFLQEVKRLLQNPLLLV